MYKGLFPLPSLARIDTGKYAMCYGTLFFNLLIKHMLR